jgi:hypothetical protein
MWPDRTYYPSALMRLREIHSSYMTIDQNTTSRELLRLRALGRRVRKRDIGRTLLFWSEGNSMVTVGQQSLRIIDF